MNRTKQNLMCMTLAVALALSAWGCGGGGGSGTTAGLAGGGGGGGGTSRLSGTVSAPADQLNQAVLSPAGESASRLQRSGHRGFSRARVVARNVVNGTVLGETQAGANGEFDMSISVSSSTHVEIAASGNGGGGTTITVSTIVMVNPGANMNVDIDLVTTIAAEAFREAVEMGLDVNEASEIEIEIEHETEVEIETELRDRVDLSGRDENRGPRRRARIRIAAMANRKIMAFLENPNPRTAMQALMASQVFAHVTLGLNSEIHLSHAQVRAFVEAMVSGRALDATMIARALAEAGVSAEAGGVITVDDCLNASRRLRRRLPAFGTEAEVSVETRFTILESLLLALQTNDPQVNFAVASQAQLDAYVRALLAVS